MFRGEKKAGVVQKTTLAQVRIQELTASGRGIKLAPLQSHPIIRLHQQVVVAEHQGDLIRQEHLIHRRRRAAHR